MSPKKRFSTIANYYPSFQDISPVALSPERWMKSRQVDDKAEGLWRLNDTLYDLTDFIESHPGGADWIRLTKGTDITEAFEVHHIYPKGPESLLVKFEIRKASEPRNFKFTFQDDGFYRTFKRRIGEKLKTVDRSPEQTSKYYMDSIVLATFVTAILSIRLDSTILSILSGLCLNYTTIGAHNFFHQKDNFRMYYFNLSFLNYRQWRIQHSMSHHLFANSIHDLEVSVFEPFLCWSPTATKTVIQRYASWIYSPIIYGFIFLNHYVKNIFFCYIEKKNLYRADDLIPFTLPLAMYLFGFSDLSTVLKTWMSIVVVGSFFFGLIGLNAGHHNVHNVHDGDALSKDMDWGIYCVDTVVDNSNVSHNHLASLTHFGNHLMHHLLPTIDHGVALQLYPILFDTMAEFETKFEEYPWFVHISGQLNQLAKNRPSVETPMERKKMRIKENSV